MPRTTIRARFRPVLGLLALALAFAVATSSAGAADHANRAPAGGEGAICAELEGRMTLGTGTPDRIVLAISGDSCQDGAGPLNAASFTGLAQFAVTHGTGRYAGATGSGLASFSEDAAKHHRMTLIGRVRSAS